MPKLKQEWRLPSLNIINISQHSHSSILAFFQKYLKYMRDRKKISNSSLFFFNYLVVSNSFFLIISTLFTQTVLLLYPIRMIPNEHINAENCLQQIYSAKRIKNLLKIAITTNSISPMNIGWHKMYGCWTPQEKLRYFHLLLQHSVSPLQ